MLQESLDIWTQNIKKGGSAQILHSTECVLYGYLFSKVLLKRLFVCVCVLQGCIPTMARAVVVNAAQLASYSQSKQALMDTGEFLVYSEHQTLSFFFWTVN